MLEISRFLGIIVTMYYRDHFPPHFHVKYGEHRGAFSIQGMELIEGRLPRRITALVLEWAFQHRIELLEDWALMKKRRPLNTIEPLV